ncbi:MAG: NusA-like transcription termination signal-binding factor [Desulfurococcales archaeon]|nr:NusA-like transcription termination signal-binding factor [Desulfurococcales archaeon]
MRGEERDDRITLEELRYISVFQELTGVTVYRCLVDEEFNRLIFLVGRGEAGRAIGRNGAKVRALKEILGKDIEVVEYSEDLKEMVKNLFPGVRIRSIQISKRGGGVMVRLSVEEADKGVAIGRNGRNVKRARLVLSRLFGVERVVIR